MLFSTIITGLIILAVGIFMVKTGREKIRLLEKYEDENAGPDGQVRFENIEEARTHGANKNLYRMITAMGFFTGFFGLIFLGYGFGLFAFPEL